MTNIFQEIKDSLTPGGSLPIVRLHLEGYFQKTFVDSVIDEMELLCNLEAINMRESNPLEQLAIQVIKDSCYWDDMSRTRELVERDLL